MWHIVLTSSLCPAGGFTDVKNSRYSSWEVVAEVNCLCVCVCVISVSASPLCIGFWLCSVGFFFHHIVYLGCLDCFLRPSQYSVRICNDCDLNVENTSTFFFNVDLALQLLLSSLLYLKFCFKDYYIILLLSCICK